MFGLCDFSAAYFRYVVSKVRVGRYIIIIILEVYVRSNGGLSLAGLSQSEEEEEEDDDNDDDDSKRKRNASRSLHSSSSFPLISVANFKRQEDNEEIERTDVIQPSSHSQTSVSSSAGANQTTALRHVTPVSEVCAGEVGRRAQSFSLNSTTPTLSFEPRGLDVNHNVSSIGATPQKQTTFVNSLSTALDGNISYSSTARCRISDTREPVTCSVSSREPASVPGSTDPQLREEDGRSGYDLLNYSEDMSKIALLLRSGMMRSTTTTTDDETTTTTTSRDSPAKNSRLDERTPETNGNNADGGVRVPSGNGFHLTNGREQQNAPSGREQQQNAPSLNSARTAFASTKPSVRKATRNPSSSVATETNGNRLSPQEGCLNSTPSVSGKSEGGVGQAGHDPTQKLTNPVHPGRSGQAKEGVRQTVRLDSDRILVSPTDDRRGGAVTAKCGQNIMQKHSLDGATRNGGGATKLTTHSVDGSSSTSLKQPQHHVHSSASSSSSSSSSSKSRSVSSRCQSKGTSVDHTSSAVQRSDEGQEVRTRSPTAAKSAIVDRKRGQGDENIGNSSSSSSSSIPSNANACASVKDNAGVGAKSVKRNDSVEFPNRTSADSQRPADTSRTRMLSDRTRSPKTEAVVHSADSKMVTTAIDDQRDNSRGNGQRSTRNGADGMEEIGGDSGGRNDETWSDGSLQLKAMQPISNRHYHHPFPLPSSSSARRPSSSTTPTTSTTTHSSSSRMDHAGHPHHHNHPPSRMDLYAVTEGYSMSRMLSSAGGGHQQQHQQQQQVRRRVPDAAVDSGYSSDSGAVYSRWMSNQTRHHQQDGALRTVRECIENPSMMMTDSASDCRLLESLALSEKTSNGSKMFGKSQSSVMSVQKQSSVTSDQNQSGMSSSQKQSGMSSDQNQSGMLSSQKQSGMSSDQNQSGMSSSQKQSSVTSDQRQSNVSSSNSKLLESASHRLADDGPQDESTGTSAWHRYCLADNKRSVTSSPATDDVNRATLPRTHGRARAGQWLRSGMGPETSKETSTVDRADHEESNEDLRAAEMMLLNSRTDGLQRQETSSDNDAWRPSRCGSHCRSPSLVAFGAKDDRNSSFHSTHQHQQYPPPHHHHPQQRRGSGDGPRIDQRESSEPPSSSTNTNNDGYFRRDSPEFNNTKRPSSSSTSQRRLHPFRLLSTPSTADPNQPLDNRPTGSSVTGRNDPIDAGSDRLGQGSDPDLVKRERPDGGGSTTQKTFGRRLQAIGSSMEAATAGRVNRLDYCNSLPRVSRARRSESVGCGAKREGTVAGRSTEVARYSLGSSSFAELMSMLSAGSASLPATPKRSLSRDDDSDVHASLLSLISSASSVYSTAEEKQAQEIRKLKSELESAHEKINTLTMQLNANVHVVTAFEQSLSNMTHRLQKLTNSSEQKDQELNNLKTTLHQLQQHSSNARAEMLMVGQRAAEQQPLTPPFAASYRLNHPDFSGLSVLNTNHRNMPPPPPPSSSSSSSCDRPHDTRSHLSLMSIASSSSSSCSSSATPSSVHHNPSITAHEATTTMAMMMPSSSPAAAAAASSSLGCERKTKKKGWLSSSFTKAFSRKKSKDLSDTEADTMSTSILEASSSVPNSPLLGTPALRSVPSTPLALPRRTIDSGGVAMQQLPETELLRESEMILQLKQQLHEKDMKLTDIRLEALSSTHQLEQLREAMNQMKMEMGVLKTENERMQNLIAEKGIADPASASAASSSSSTSAPVVKMHSSPTTIPPGTASSSNSSNSTSVASSSLLKKSLVLGEPSHFDSLSMESISKDAASPRYTVAVQLGPWTPNDAKSPSSPASTAATASHSTTNAATPSRQVLIGTVGLTSTTKWETLDSTVRRIFKEHVCRLDPGSGLGLNGESVLCYHVGEITRTKGSKMPELLPCGYLVGHHTTIILSLRGAHERSLDSLAFETLVPKTVVQRYVSLLVEHKRLVLSGPSGSGKTYLATKLAEYLVVLSGRDLDDNAISTFSVDCKSGRELKQYLSTISDSCHASGRMTEGNSIGGGSRELPVVIVVDNLQHVVSFEDTFSTFLDLNCKSCPYIIGTMTSSSTSSSSSSVNTLHPVHHGFRWVLLTIQSEPVRNFLCRHLQRRLVSQEVTSNTRSGQMTRIVDWMVQVWIQLNKFLMEEIHSTSEQSLGTRLFASCPMEVQASEEWFADLWNYSIVPYLIEATKEQYQQQQQQLQQGQGDNSRPPLASQASDPTLWVIDNYPWPATDKNKERTVLLRLRGDNDCEKNAISQAQQQQQQSQQQGGMNPSASPGASNCLHGGQRKTSISSKDPLMTMLERLKEAANETGSAPAIDLH